MQGAQQPDMSAELGRYALGRRIAVGGMAEVFEAHDTEHNERVVVKLLLPHLCSDNDVLQMFADEARLTTQLTHANLVRTRDTGELRGRPYLVMELVDGCTLDALVKRSGALPPDLVARISLDVLRALAYLHGYRDEAGQWLHIVHRDVNPRNVLLSRTGEVKLADFGIARSRVRSYRTRSGVIKGTVQYMSPEQITGSDLDHRADLYGVGLLLFEMLTGRPYIEGAQEIDLLRLAESPCWRAPSKVRSELSAVFDELLQPALMRFPEQRYRDAVAFQDALKRTLDAAGVYPASPASLGELVTSLPARSGTVPPLLTTTPTPTASATDRREAPVPPSHSTAVLASWLARRHITWLAGAGLVALALAGTFLWHWRASAPPAGTSAAPTSSGRTATPPTNRRPQIAVPPTHRVTTSAPSNSSPPAVATAAAAAVGPTMDSDSPAAGAPPAAPPASDTERAQTATRRRPLSAPRAARRPHHPSVARRTSPDIRLAAAQSPEQPDSPPAKDQRLVRLQQRLAAARMLLRNRGVRAADLSPEMRQSLQETTRAVERKDIERATALLAALERQAATTVVDRAFVQRKLGRVDRALRHLPPQRHDLQRLRQRSTQALQAFMDGDFDLANRQLNQILTLLSRSP